MSLFPPRYSMAQRKIKSSSKTGIESMDKQASEERAKMEQLRERRRMEASNRGERVRNAPDVRPKLQAQYRAECESFDLQSSLLKQKDAQQEKQEEAALRKVHEEMQRMDKQQMAERRGMQKDLMLANKALWQEQRARNRQEQQSEVRADTERPDFFSNFEGPVY